MSPRRKICTLLAAASILVVVTTAIAQNVPLTLLEQPKPALPKNYGTLDVTGTIALRVEFLANGQIGKITPIKSLTSDLTNLAIVAARKISFEPERRDGTPINVSRTLEYSHSWETSGWAAPSGLRHSSRVVVDPQAEAIIARAVQNLGGDKYLKVTSQIGTGRFSVIRDGAVISFQKFVDVIVFPDKERTEFKGSGSKTVQTNVGDTGWLFDGDQELIKLQDEKQIEGFKRSIRTSLDTLLRGYWRGKATLSYVGKRAATLGKRNDVVKLTYDDGFSVEFEFAAEDGTPQKAVHKRQNADGEDVQEEDRYAQFIDAAGIKTAFIIDRFTNGVQSSRINYETIEFNKPINDSIFAKPSNVKELKKDLKL